MKLIASDRRGFTLIELLVVVAILGILAAFVLIAINPGKRMAQARDAQRKSDIRTIADSLLEHFVIYGKYPDEAVCDSSIGSDTVQNCQQITPGSDWSPGSSIYEDLVTKGYLKLLPKDPINRGIYYYVYEPEDNKFWIGARLESPQDPAKPFFRCTDNELYRVGCAEEGEDVGMYSYVPPGGEVVIPSESEPLRAAFYYAWYPEQWSAAGHRFNSVFGEYNSSDTAVIDDHIDQMKYAYIDAGIYSWWGTGHLTNQRFDSYLDRAEAKGFRWAIYYELDWNGSRSQWAIENDIKYLRSNYFNRPGYLYVNNKPVVFVYMPTGGGCSQVAKWTTVRNNYNLFVSMMDVPEWWTCNTLDSWHGYKPDTYVKSVYVGTTVYSISASAGFWAAWEADPRLARDFSQWQNAVSAMVSFNPKWQLVYFNEFGEGTNIEPSDARCMVVYCADYLEELRKYP